jgi:hypothetical protein
MISSNQLTVMDDAPVRAIDSSTNASPIVVTDASHNLNTGDYVTITGHDTNTAANGFWKITKVDANKFSLDGSTGNGIGAGTGTWAKMETSGIFADDAEAISVTIDTDGGGDAEMTIKIWSSDAEDCPNIGADQSASNQYDYVDIVDKEDGASIDGDTGFSVSGADDHRQFDVNIGRARWVGALATDGTEGEVTVKFRLYNKI